VLADSFKRQASEDFHRDQTASTKGNCNVHTTKSHRRSRHFYGRFNPTGMGAAARHH
jgi:hypothetical protein